MRQERKTRSIFLQDINFLKKKIEEVEESVDRNGVRVEDLIKRMRNILNNFEKKIEAIEKMASKERR